jgi:predicted ATP-grasp superfamily ATP-dependent carboligase
MTMHVIIAGVTTRALAQSAARAGWRVTAVDAFGDQDLRAVAEVVGSRAGGHERFSATEAARAAKQIAASAVTYTSNFENYPVAVALLSNGRRLLGNPPYVLEQIRNPITLMRALRRRGFTVPDTRASAPSRPDARPWLRKPRRSGGGHGTAPWRRGRVPRSAYLQARVEGTPGSISFLADGRRVVPIGISRQLVGERAFGGSGYRYCGSILSGGHEPLFARAAEVTATARALATAVTEEFGLIGLNGLDFVAHDGIPYPIEVNPRYSASMELVERISSSTLSLFELHARACEGALPGGMRTRPTVVGKAIVFARRDADVPPAGWSGIDIADIPRPGERIARGRPICTVFAEADSVAKCRAGLVRAAALVYRAVEAQARGVA